MARQTMSLARQDQHPTRASQIKNPERIEPLSPAATQSLLGCAAFCALHFRGSNPFTPCPRQWKTHQTYRPPTGSRMEKCRTDPFVIIKRVLKKFCC
jgi:hypothetical protein